jgi:hypothetical protein
MTLWVDFTTEHAYPPPPPPPPPTAGLFAEGFHLPRTNLFMSIRRQLSSLEQLAQFKAGRGPALGFLLFFFVGGLVPVAGALGIQYGIQSALGPNIWVSWVFIAPLVRGIFMFLGMLIVGYLVLSIIPNRRYGVAFAALAGMGHGIFMDIVYAAQSQGLDPFWYLMLPFEYLILASFLGMGVFALVAKAPAGKGFLNAILGLPLLFFLVYLALSFVYFGIATLTIGPYWGVKYLVLPLLVFILRDFLGGHFNFQHFFETIPEAPVPQPGIHPPPPP